jgi:HptB-dependent secretion and biofilm anti anti-sigma factor
MDYRLTTSGTANTIHLSGQFIFSDNQKFKEIIELVHAGTFSMLSVDFSAVSFIDSAAMGMLLLLRDECERLNIPLSIGGTYGQVQKIFLISKFDQLFSMQTH